MADTLVTPEFRTTFLSVFKPFTGKNDDGSAQQPKFICAGVFPKGADLSKLRAAAEGAMAAKFGADPAGWPDGWRSPFRKAKSKWKTVNGKLTAPPGFEDPDAIFMTFTANPEYPPGVVDEGVEPILDAKLFYSGCFARASVRAYAYAQKGNKGVSFGLVNVQKLRNGDPIGGGVRDPASDFEKVVSAPAASGKGAGGMFDE